MTTLPLDNAIHVTADDPRGGEGAAQSLDRVLLLTVIVLLLYADTTSLLQIPFKVACGAAILFPAVRGSAAWWASVTAFMVFVNAGDWHVIDNHKYLITFWSVCVTIGLLSGDPRAVLRTNAGLFVGLCFAMAALWKVIGGEYADGTFVASTFLFDSRVHEAAAVIGPVPRDQLGLMNRVVSLAMSAPTTETRITLDSPERLLAVSRWLGWAAVVGEGMVALAWLAPVGVFRRFRHTLLLFFILVTYFFLPVVGFASILALLGFAWSWLSGLQRTAGIYLMALAVVQLYSFPWPAWVLGG